MSSILTVDEIVTYISDIIYPLFKKLNYTANGIALVSLIVGVGSLWYLFNKGMIWFMICAIIYYVLNNMAKNVDPDNKIAMYNDLFMIVAVLAILISKYQLMDFPVTILLISTMAILLVMSTNCDITTNNKCDILRYFGPGTFFLFMLGVILYVSNTAVFDSDYEIKQLDLSSAYNIQKNYQNTYTIYNDI